MNKHWEHFHFLWGLWKTNTKQWNVFMYNMRLIIRLHPLLLRSHRLHAGSGMLWSHYRCELGLQSMTQPLWIKWFSLISLGGLEVFLWQSFKLQPRPWSLTCSCQVCQPGSNYHRQNPATSIAHMRTDNTQWQTLPQKDISRVGLSYR